MSSGKASKSQGTWGVLRPGPEATERWRGVGGRDPQPLPESAPLPPAQRLIVAIPTRAALGIPLWLSPEAKPEEVVAMEFTSRHLIRREAPVYALTIEANPDRHLVLGVSPTDDPAMESFPGARHFELPARLMVPNGHDVLIWKEEGTICHAFYRDDQCVFFSSTGSRLIDPETAALIFRCGLRLEAEEIVKHLPSKAGLLGDFTEAESACLAKHFAVQAAVHGPPRLPHKIADLPPPQVVAARARRKTLHRVGWIAAAAAIIYGAILLTLGGQYVLRERQLGAIRDEERSIAAEAAAARGQVERWQTVRRAVDPADFLLDVMAAIVRAIPSDSMRLTQLRFDVGSIDLSGEAGDVRQAYGFLERLQADPALVEYSWDARPPQIGGRDMVRFTIEGRRADARTDSE
jgi:hypothetical protein